MEESSVLKTISDEEAKAVILKSRTKQEGEKNILSLNDEDIDYPINKTKLLNHSYIKSLLKGRGEAELYNLINNTLMEAQRNHIRPTGAFLNVGTKRNEADSPLQGMFVMRAAMTLGGGRRRRTRRSKKKTKKGKRSGVKRSGVKRSRVKRSRVKRRRVKRSKRSKGRRKH